MLFAPFSFTFLYGILKTAISDGTFELKPETKNQRGNNKRSNEAKGSTTGGSAIETKAQNSHEVIDLL